MEYHDEIIFKDLLRSLDKEKIKYYLSEYIKEKHLYSEYIDFISKIASDYTTNTNKFIESFKRNVNVLYLDENLGYDIFKNVDINEKNWYWYARLLKYSEDEIYPKNNYLQPTYLLKRLKPIIAYLDTDNLDEELKDLYNICLNLISKYKA